MRVAEEGAATGASPYPAGPRGVRPFYDAAAVGAGGVDAGNPAVLVSEDGERDVPGLGGADILVGDPKFRIAVARVESCAVQSPIGERMGGMVANASESQATMDAEVGVRAEASEVWVAMRAVAADGDDGGV